jgi:Protein of unknown function (DUF3631)
VTKQFDASKAAKILALVLGSPSAGERANAGHLLRRMLSAHSIAGCDLLSYYLDRAVVEQINDLLHPLWTGDHDATREQRRALVERRLLRWRMGWSDLIEQIRTGSSDLAAWHWLLDETGRALVVTEEVSISILDQIAYLIGQYVALDADQLTVATLWAAHTHIYPFYMCSPRLAVCGPMNTIGKTVTFDVLNRLVLRPWRAASATDAALYSDTDGARITMLIDEMHYADLRSRRAAILHAGYRQGTPIRLAKRSIDAAFGFIGSCLTPELQSRSLFIQMRRDSGQLRRFDLADTSDLDAVYQRICDWAANVQLDRDPQLPPELQRHSRWGDNARPLVAIADTAGKQWGEAARKALVNLIVLHQSEHPNALLIRHLHQIFAERGYPTAMWGADIVAALLAQEDWPWSEYRGPAGKFQPRPLRQTDLALMLHQFDARIRPRSVRIGERTAKGYPLEQLEPQFAAYCEDYQPRKMEAAE